MALRIRVALTLLAACLVLSPVTPAAAQSPSRLVLAFYYTWFDEHSWGPDQVPDVPVTPYVSTDPSVMARQIEEAKGAGIDAFVVDWLGPQVENNQTETNLRAMLDVAAAHGFRLAVDFEVTSGFYGGPGDVQAALKSLLDTHAKHPAYLKVGGKPVIFFWRQQIYDTGTWAAIRSAVDPDHRSLWIEEGTDVSPLSVFDGHHLYSVTWNPPTDLGYTADKFARLVRGEAAVLGTPKIYVATVMPGYDDLKTGRATAFATDREGGAYYESSWQAAVASAPDWIVITSFNEFPEGTYIEPSRAYGNLYLNLTAKWAAVFHGGKSPPAQPVVAAVAAPTATPPSAAADTSGAPEASPTVSPAGSEGAVPAISPADVIREERLASKLAYAMY